MSIQFISKLAPYMNGFLLERSSSGFINHKTILITLKRLDSFIVDKKFDTGIITKELSEEWCVQLSTENINTRNSRVTVLRNLANYIISTGGTAYISPSYGSQMYSKPYVPTRAELKLFFRTIDSYYLEKNGKQKYEQHILITYKVLFRMYYLLGLRLNECCMLKRKDCNLINGYILIKQSKGNKDRILWLQDDMVQMLREFDFYMEHNIFPNREWFFLRYDKNSYLPKTSVDNKFNFFWTLTFPKWEKKRPTVHSLRHAFVVHRLNDWVEEGNKAEQLLPYLSRFLGHSSVEETFYYYHSFDTESKAFHNIIENNTKLSEETLNWLD